MGPRVETLRGFQWLFPTFITAQTMRFAKRKRDKTNQELTERESAAECQGDASVGKFDRRVQTGCEVSPHCSGFSRRTSLTITAHYDTTNCLTTTKTFQMLITAKYIFIYIFVHNVTHYVSERNTTFIRRVSDAHRHRCHRGS